MKTLNVIKQNGSCCTTAKNNEMQETFNDLNKELPTVIIGGGPIGLAAASHLVEQNQYFIVLEAGSEIAHNIRTWGHVTLFSPWRYNINKAARALLIETDWQEPNLETLPTGHELIDLYLKPLAELAQIKPFIQLNTKVVGVSRQLNDKMKSKNRVKQSFKIYVEKGDDISIIEAKAVIDATGTWGNPNPANSTGVWLQTEKVLAENIEYGIPDIKMNTTRYANKKIAVIGGGHSAINTLLSLVELQKENPLTKLVWIMRKNSVEEVYGGKEKDALKARGALGIRIQELVDTGKIEVVTPFYISMVKKDGKINIVGTLNDQQTVLTRFDELIVNAGNRPDFTINSELRLSIDTVTESVQALAPLIDPNVHSCGTVRAHGEEILRQPEKGFYIVGAKSYGRAPTFLMATGYEQVRSITAYLAGNEEASQRMELELPETGVCSSNLSNKSNACC
ncbi:MULTISPECIES: NAD(P)-binding domain-containing protein [unclassified Lysinibacillus]|uniref:NAD(P)-binding domain-containing protein n=1 Tax=unclassified Lysinibacillus TaxID=2636778 RepID=UPI000881AD67|nr:MULTISPECIES: NAD(P)-binding domain-containing protein [unclassified Lysinibacillus]SCY34157.1 Pyridine nucleotide-disulphide oxidoreductase [Lysinibacillus sp. SG9]SDB17637.1 Pyridine nucleotide-disulphide oxidoreductase [Lysinibacillus sp. TC-37]SFS65167.1 Pyridine nucleotide-disulphide oxidoreductase [Lysinibacillus sp. SG55]